MAFSWVNGLILLIIIVAIVGVGYFVYTLKATTDLLGEEKTPPNETQEFIPFTEREIQACVDQIQETEFYCCYEVKDNKYFYSKNERCAQKKFLWWERNLGERQIIENCCQSIGFG